MTQNNGGLGEFGWGLLLNRREFGVGLLLVEAWVFAVVAFACFAPSARFSWLAVIPYMLLVPPAGVLRESIVGWKGVVASITIWMSAALVGFLLRPLVTNWLLAAMLH